MGELEDEAKARHERHLNHPTHRPLSDDYELIGLKGEEVLCSMFGQSVDLTPRPGGDKGKDCWITVGSERFLADVKTAKKPYHLIVERGKVKPKTIYFLADYNGGSPTLLGWEWGSKVLRAPTRDFGYGVINHFIPAGELRKVEALLERIHQMADTHLCHCGAYGAFGTVTREGIIWACRDHSQLAHESCEKINVDPVSD